MDALETPAESLERVSCVPVPTALYRHFNAEGRLLYVGISLSPTYRLAQHRDASAWFQQIASITVAWFDDRMAALKAEKEAIQSEHPEFNVVYKVTAREAYLMEQAEESCAELTRKVTRFSPSYTIESACATIGMGPGPVRFALFHGDLPFIWTGNRIAVTGWALIAYMEALQSGALRARGNQRGEDGVYPKPPNIEAILANNGISR